MKLARKIIALLLATFLVLLITLGYFETLRASRDYRQLVTADLTTTGRSLRPAFREVCGAEGIDRAVQIVQRDGTAETPNVQIRWSPFDRLDSTDLSATQRAALLSGSEVTTTGGGASSSQDRRLHVYVPVPEARGALVVSQASTAERAIVEHVVQDQITLATAAVVGAALLSVLAGLFVVGRPIQALVNQARRIGAGHWSERLSLDRDDELGELAREMNGMCDELEQVQRRLEHEAEARVGAVEQLRHSDRLRTVGTLASGVAHELGTPLSVIAGRANMIAASQGAEHADCAKNAAAIVTQVNRIAHIIRGLLDFARRGRAEKVRLDLRELAQRTVELIGPLAVKKRVNITLDVGDQPLLAKIDVAQAEQALANLVVNGLDAMKGGGELTLRTRKVRANPPHGQEGDFVQVVVRDRGVGISGEHLAHVFEPFFTTKDVGEGTGLGLSVTYGIMQDHAGFIDVESKLGEGSTFALYFPSAA